MPGLRRAAPIQPQLITRGSPQAVPLHRQPLQQFRRHLPEGNFAMGAIYATLPAGCITPNVQGKTYYLCGNTWFKPQYGANGVFYKVVPTP